MEIGARNRNKKGNLGNFIYSCKIVDPTAPGFSEVVSSFRYSYTQDTRGISPEASFQKNYFHFSLYSDVGWSVL